jgi:hypothetical protein
VSGTIVEHHLPCGHEEMARPDMLAEVWDQVTGSAFRW